MDIDGLFEALAGYLDFIISLVLLQGMEEYSKLESVSPKLVTYFVVGVFIAYLISTAKTIPGYQKLVETGSKGIKDDQETKEAKSQAEDKSKNLVDKPDMAQFVLLSILGAFLLHGFLIIYNSIFETPTIYSVQDTLNAVLAYNALYNPMNALLQQLQRGLKALIGVNRTITLFSAFFLIVLSITYFGSLVFLLYPLAAVHDTSMVSMLWPNIAFVAVVFFILFLFFLVLGGSLKDVLNRK